MKQYISLARSSAWVVPIAVIVSVFGVVSLVQAASTISTNISTGGTLSVTGASTLTGAVSAASTLGVTGLSTLTAGVAVGATANTVTDMSVGYCTIPTTTVTASSTQYADCTTNVTISTSDRVFVQATSSLPANFVVKAASTTGATKINVLILNTGMIAGTATGVNSFNFWAAQ